MCERAREEDAAAAAAAVLFEALCRCRAGLGGDRDGLTGDNTTKTCTDRAVILHQCDIGLGRLVQDARDFAREKVYSIWEKNPYYL